MTNQMMMMMKLWTDHHQRVIGREETNWVSIYYINIMSRCISFIENGTRGGKGYGGMTADLSDDDQLEMGREDGGMDDEEEQLDEDVDPRRRGGGNIGRRPPSASGQRRQKRQPQQRGTYNDDEDF
jgi:hypothetical protein